LGAKRTEVLRSNIEAEKTGRRYVVELKVADGKEAARWGMADREALMFRPVAVGGK
jgi:hypothetical protein